MPCFCADHGLDTAVFARGHWGTGAVLIKTLVRAHVWGLGGGVEEEEGGDLDSGTQWRSALVERGGDGGSQCGCVI